MLAESLPGYQDRGGFRDGRRREPDAPPRSTALSPSVSCSSPPCPGEIRLSASNTARSEKVSSGRGESGRSILRSRLLNHADDGKHIGIAALHRCLDVEYSVGPQHDRARRRTRTAQNHHARHVPSPSRRGMPQGWTRSSGSSTANGVLVRIQHRFDQTDSVSQSQRRLLHNRLHRDQGRSPSAHVRVDGASRWRRACPRAPGPRRNARRPMPCPAQ